jgi:hypothetical protein
MSDPLLQRMVRLSPERRLRVLAQLTDLQARALLHYWESIEFAPNVLPFVRPAKPMGNDGDGGDDAA